MARKMKLLADLRQEWALDGPLGGRLRPALSHPERLTPTQRMNAVCEGVLAGRTFAEIACDLKERYGDAGTVARELFEHLHRAGDEGWLKYDAPEHEELSRLVKERYPWLRGARVVHTSTIRHVAEGAAAVVLDLLRGFRDREEVHIGLAGGMALHRVSIALASLLCRPDSAGGLPAKLVLHPLVAMFDPHDPTADPSTFVTFFFEEIAARVKFDFVGFPAPGIIRTEDRTTLLEIDLIRATWEAASEIDILITSGSEWADDHALLRWLLRYDRPSLKALDEEHCVGDMLWRPIGPRGPIERETARRAFTLFDLHDLPRFIEGGGHVVLTLGPCAACNRPKGQLLRAILDSEQQLVSHLVTDSRSARSLRTAGFRHDGRVGNGQLHPDGDATRLDTQEKKAAVCELVCDGWTVAEVVRKLKGRYGKDISIVREQIYPYVRAAGMKGHLVLRPPWHIRSAEHIRREYPRLRRVAVVDAAAMRDVADEAARVLLELIREYADRGKVHLGMAGGSAMRHVSRALLELLRRPGAGPLPRTFVWHALAAGMSGKDPTTNPSSFLHHFVERGLKGESSMVGFPAPSMVSRSEISPLHTVDGIESVFEAAEEIDIIVTSGAEWFDPHAQVRTFLKGHPESLRRLEEERIVGDMLWQPIGPAGPITEQGEYRAFTLFDLAKLPRLIEQKKKVVLALGPCSQCARPKGELLRTILKQDPPLVTHLITDLRSAMDVWTRDEEEGAL